MSELCYERLDRELYLATTQSTDAHLRCIAATLYATGVIDACFRLRQAVSQFPGLKKDIGYKTFIEKTNAIEDIRHILQHQNREIPNFERERSAPLGLLTWIYRNDEVDEWTFGLMHAGSWFPGQVSYGPVIDRHSLPPLNQISNVALKIGSVKAEFAPIREIQNKLIQCLEESIRSHTNNKETLGSDPIIIMPCQGVAAG
ncbi:MAG: hypothetical protein ACTHMT_05670 [Verrucomicrobiota bacterium]